MSIRVRQEVGSQFRNRGREVGGWDGAGGAQGEAAVSPPCRRTTWPSWRRRPGSGTGTGTGTGSSLTASWSTTACRTPASSCAQSSGRRRTNRSGPPSPGPAARTDPGEGFWSPDRPYRLYALHINSDWNSKRVTFTPTSLLSV